MKKIFVTVTEFRRGGGLLKKGREIFDDIGEEEGIYETTYGTEKIICYCGGIATELHQEDAYVRINCTPHYI